MTVKELIKALSEITDETMEVIIYNFDTDERLKTDTAEYYFGSEKFEIGAYTENVRKHK